MGRPVLSEDIKNKISKLVDIDFVKQVLNKHLPQHYPNFKEITNLKLYTYKKHLGLTSAVFVVEYKIDYIDKRGESRRLYVFASAHSDGSRWGAYQNNLALYNNGGFSNGSFRVTRPLFFLSEQQAFFYQSSPGKSLFDWFTKNPQADLNPVLLVSAGWIKKLHGLDKQLGNINWPMFKIANMVPAPNDFVADFIKADAEQGQSVKAMLGQLNDLEAKLSDPVAKSLIYGDYHPENIVIRDLNTDKIEMIDFTDVAYGDPMVDLGAFLEQFDFMMHRLLPRPKINEYETFFLEAYFGKKFADIDQTLINRINLYQAWTALRIAVFLFYAKSVHINELLGEVEEYLKAIHDNRPIINLYN